MAWVIENHLSNHQSSSGDNIFTIDGTTLGTKAGEMLFGFFTCALGSATITSVNTNFTLVGPIEYSGQYRCYYMYKVAASDNEGVTVNCPGEAYIGGDFWFARISGVAGTLVQNTPHSGYQTNIPWNDVTVATDNSLVLWLLEAGVASTGFVAAQAGTTLLYDYGNGTSCQYTWVAAQNAAAGTLTGLVASHAQCGHNTFAVAIPPAAIAGGWHPIGTHRNRIITST